MVTIKSIANVFDITNKRIGIVIGRKETKFFGLIQKVSFCFQGRNGFKPAQYGWCKDVTDIHTYIKKMYPMSTFAPNSEFDTILDSLEGMIERLK
jgi:hypothetical protein